MENAKRDFRGHGAHRRFFGWAKDKMTGEEAFDILYGEKDAQGREYPEGMKKEFTELFAQMKEMHEKIHGDRKAFKEKWGEYMPEEREFPKEGGFGEQGPNGRHGEGFPGHRSGFPGGGHGFFGM